MADNVKDIVDLAMDDKPNKAGEALDSVLRDRLADKVDNLKNELSNQMFGQEWVADAEPVEVQPELDLEPEKEEETAEADQELIQEPDEDELDKFERELDDDEGEDEQPEQEEPVEDEEENEIT